MTHDDVIAAADPAGGSEFLASVAEAVTIIQGEAAPARAWHPTDAWMRPADATTLVVVKSRSFAETRRDILQSIFPGAFIAPMGTSLTGWGFDRIIMLARGETERDRRWVMEVVTTRMKTPGQKLLWLV